MPRKMSCLCVHQISNGERANDSIDKTHAMLSQAMAFLKPLPVVEMPRVSPWNKTASIALPGSSVRTRFPTRKN